MGKVTKKLMEQSLDSKTSSKKSDSEIVSKKKKVRPGTKFGAKKGKNFEREIATALGHIFPDAQRMLEYQGSNVIGVDLENTDIFRFQCKCTANYKNPNAIFEIREKGPHVPVLVTKANNRSPMAVLPFQEFVTLLEMAYGHRERLINPYVQDASPSALALAMPLVGQEGTRINSHPHPKISLPPLKSEISLARIVDVAFEQLPIHAVEEAKKELIEQTLISSFL